MRSDIEISAPAADEGPVDLSIVSGPPVGTADVPAGVELAKTDVGGRRLATIVRDGDVVRCRYHGVCDVELEGVTAIVRADPDGDPERIPLLLIGAVLAAVVDLRGGLVLHASTMLRRDRAVAVAGPSGSGKSTIAAVAVASGWTVLADDAVRVDVGEHGAICHEGSRTIRLRPGAEELGRGSTARAVDGRLLLPGTTPVPALAPLAAIVVPRIADDADAVEVTQLRGAAALAALPPCSRIIWTDPERRRARLTQLAQLATAVPIMAASLPRRDRRPTALDELVEQLTGLAG